MAESNFTVRVPDDLKEAFSKAASVLDRTAAQLVREFMRNLVQETRDKQEYEDWFRAQVEAGQLALKEGRVSANADVEARFDARRAKARAKTSGGA